MIADGEICPVCILESGVFESSFLGLPSVFEFLFSFRVFIFRFFGVTEAGVTFLDLFLGILLGVASMSI
jgi:hypothetical protein